jgi:choline-sulfatase
VPQPPNILFILCDQLAPQWLELAHTPHHDALAARGTPCQHPYCNSPICAPSRASLATGQLPSAIGAYDNGANFQANTPTFMSALADAGYATWLSGKMHFIGPDQHHGFQRRLTTDIYPASHVWTPDWNQSPVHNPGTAVDQLQTAGLCTWNMQMDYDEETHFRALEALRDLARTQASSHHSAEGASASAASHPWLLCASYTHPHDPFITTREWWDLYDHDQIPMPANTGTAHHPYDQWLQIHHMIDVYPPAPEHVRNARHAYLANISYLDHKVGQLTAELDRLGLAENTVIVFTSDHGEMLGEHDMWFKRTWREPSTRIPLIFAGQHDAAPISKLGQIFESEVSLLDLFPTFLELAIPISNGTASNSLAPRWGGEGQGEGASLMSAIHGDDSLSARPILGEYLSEGVCQPMRYIVQDRLKYVHVHDTQPELLFDLTLDPHETINLIDDPAYTDRLTPLRTALHENWNPAAQRETILASQQHRRETHRQMQERGEASWDVPPDIDPSPQYVRPQNAHATNDARRLN